MVTKSHGYNKEDNYQFLTEIGDSLLSYAEDFIIEMERTNYPTDHMRLFYQLYERMQQTLNAFKFDDFFKLVKNFLISVSEISITPRMDQLLIFMRGVLTELNSAFNKWYLQMNFTVDRLEQIGADQLLINVINSLIKDFWQSKEQYRFGDVIEIYHIYVDALNEYFSKNPHMERKYRLGGDKNV